MTHSFSTLLYKPFLGLILRRAGTCGSTRRLAFFALLSVFASAWCQADDHSKTEAFAPQNFNQGWQYLEQKIDDVKVAKTTSGWVPVDLPHTWNAFDTVDSTPGYRRSASWYRKTLKTPEDKLRSILYFEGANFETQLYVNDKYVGEHIGGYIGFDMDITDFLKKGADNDIMVRVSNRYNPNLIPSQKSDFFLFGGISRDVWLKRVPDNHITKVVVRTPKVSAQTANTEIEVSVAGNGAKGKYDVQASLRGPDKALIQQTTQSLHVNKKDASAVIKFSDLISPQLWSIEVPNLYSVEVELVDENDQVVHAHNERFGYRWFEMKAQQGFFLNGERVLIRGTHRHEEHAGLGNAVSNAQHRKDMAMIKEMGANFVRLGHYPQDPEVYRAADELGLILWDELPWCRGGKGGKEWENNTERLWRQQIHQNINHPSIAFWSLGNEIYWESDFPGGGETKIINPYLKKLNKIAKDIDPTRLTTIRKYYPGADLVDAFSPSIWAGWYGGAYAQYEEALSNAHQKYPNFLHMEYGGSSHVGRHTETPISPNGLIDAQVSVSEAVNQAVVKSVAKDSDWNENYIVDLFDWHLRVSENFEGFAGNAQWAFKDFGTPLRPLNPLPYVNQKGLVDREGKPKDAYYVFASYWASEPFCYIESKTWTHRNGPKEGRDVAVFCNTDSAELFLNGKSLGKKDKDPKAFPAGGLVWKTPFKNGKNVLEVVGYREGERSEKIAEDQLQVQYLIGEHGKFDHINLSAKKIGDTRWLISAEALDKDGNRVLDYSERAYFHNIGDRGKLLENYGTPTKSSIIEMASGFASIEYEAEARPSLVEFRTQNIKGVYVEVGGK